jgi:nucleotide-binding universal stress UspA family protein
MKILIGYDGSECSDLAIEDLRKAGLPAEAQAVVLTVGEAWDLPVAVDRVSASAGRFVHPTTRQIEKHLREVSARSQNLAEVAARRVEEIFPGWNVSAEALCGKAAVELIRKADEWSPDLLVVGSQGRSAIGRLLLGSVSHQILHEAHCPVRIARKNETGESPAVRILVAVDGSPNADLVVQTIAGRNWASDTEIRLIAVDDPFSRTAAGYISWNPAENKPEESEKSQEWIKKVIDAPSEIIRSAGLQVSHNLRWGDAANMILNEAEEWKADSIFLGARGLGRFKRFLLGSVSSAVAAKAKCSVEVVR